MESVAERSWRIANRERLNAEKRAWYYANKERAKATHQAWCAKNVEYTREKYRAYKAKWGRENRDKTQSYRAQNRAMRASAIGRLTRREWEAIKNRQGGRCFDCSQISKLTVGHLVPVHMGGSHLPVNIVGQCMPCNWKQGSKMHPRARPTIFDVRVSA